jgi:hypothetical protein
MEVRQASSKRVRARHRLIADCAPSRHCGGQSSWRARVTGRLFAGRPGRGAEKRSGPPLSRRPDPKGGTDVACRPVFGFVNPERLALNNGSGFLYSSLWTPCGEHITGPIQPLPAVENPARGLQAGRVRQCTLQAGEPVSPCARQQRRRRCEQGQPGPLCE